MGRAEGETHHPAGVTGRGMMGFAALYPSYVAESPRQASAAIANERLRSAWSKMLAVSSSSSGRWRSTKAEMPARSWSSSPSTVQASDCSTNAFSAGLHNAPISSNGGGNSHGHPRHRRTHNCDRKYDEEGRREEVSVLQG